MTRAAVAILILTCSVTAPAWAQIYRWTDEQGTAHFAEGLANVPARYRGQAVMVSPRVSPPAPVAAPARGPSRQSVIRFSPGRQIIVEARVNGSVTCRLMLDTGAAATLISPRVLEAAGVSLTDGVQAVRARGLARDAELQVNRVVVDSLEVGGARADRLMVVAYDMDFPHVDGLLGQDFLALFDVNIDSSAGVVTLDPR